jgi:hypothetical protein
MEVDISSSRPSYISHTIRIKMTPITARPSATLRATRLKLVLSHMFKTVHRSTCGHLDANDYCTPDALNDTYIPALGLTCVPAFTNVPALRLWYWHRVRRLFSKLRTSKVDVLRESSCLWHKNQNLIQFHGPLQLPTPLHDNTHALEESP